MAQAAQKTAGGSTRMLVTLAAFCAGGFLGSLNMGRWAATPSFGNVSLAHELGWGAALALQFGVLLILWLGFRYWARGNRQRPLWGEGLSWRKLLTGPWPLLLSAGLLAGLNWVTPAGAVAWWGPWPRRALRSL